MISIYGKNNKKGFTLIEVVIVLVILAILAAISVPALSGYVSDATDRSRIKETESIAVAAESAVYKVYKLGTSIEDINSNKESAKNLRAKILNMAGASGKIVSFHVSNGTVFNSPSESTEIKNAPFSLDFTKEGTLEFMEYEGSGGWVGQYRILSNGSSDVRTVDSPEYNSGVSVE